MYPSIVIANFFVKKSIDTGIELTPMKLIKLVYIAHGWYLALTEESLINEAVKVWKYGPVIETIYQAFKHFGKSQITELYDNYGLGIIKISNEYDISFLDKVWEVYSGFNGLQLSTLTHQDGSPWSSAISSGNDFIPNNLIKEHYKERLK